LETKYQNLHQEVIEGCLLGDRQAQYQLYKLYAKAMYNVCLRVTNNEMEAEDVLQESFVSAFSQIHSYKGTASFGSWLKRITLNNAINVVKKRKIEFQQVDDYSDYDERYDTVDENDYGYDIKQVKSSITLLPEGYRLVLTLYLIEGYDHKEIAQILEITESTSKSQFNRSKKKLKEILKQQFQNAG
jgi:RNA polymerase sigma-70 factor (ECF subfamily)